MSFQSATDELAANLPGAWRIEHRYEHHAVITREDGMELRLLSRGWRVEIAPIMPAPPGGGYWRAKDFGLDTDEPRATFDLRRMEGKAVRVAAEAYRRVVEPWEPMWRQCCARRDQRITEREAAADIVQRLVEILHGTVVDGPVEEGRDAHVRSRHHEMWSDFRVSAFGSGSVDLTLRHLPGWAAIKIAEVIAALPKPNSP